MGGLQEREALTRVLGIRLSDSHQERLTRVARAAGFHSVSEWARVVLFRECARVERRTA